MSSPQFRDRRWIPLALMVGFVGICVGAPVWFWHLLRGDSARTTAAPVEVRRAAKRPPVPTEWPDPGCALPIVGVSIYALDGVPESLNPPLTEVYPLPDQIDVFVVLEPEAEQAVFLGTIAPGDTLNFGDIPCRNVQALELRLDGQAVGRIRGLPSNGSVVVPIAPVQQVTFRVVDAIDEAPIPDAWSSQPVELRGQTADADGVLRWVRPRVRVSYASGLLDVIWDCRSGGAELYAPGYRVGTVRYPSCGVRASPDAPLEVELDDLERTVALEPARTVYVHCVDSVGETRPCPGDLSCMPSWSVSLEAACQASPTGVSEARTTADLCYCPYDEAVVRGLGRSISVPDDAEDVYLDIDFGTGVEGTLLPEDGETRGCSVVAERVAAELSDLGSIGAIGRVRGTCDAAERRFEVLGLSAGDWVLEVQSRETDLPDERLRVAVAVPDLAEGELRDVGAVDVRDGSSLTVLCTDGLTGDELDGLLSFILHDGSRYEVGYAQAVGCGRTQHPVLAGEWDVFVLPYAHVREHVVVHEGESVEVELVLGDDDSLRALGATLGLGDDGLEVISVQPGGALELLGVRGGDEIVDISVFGMPLPIESYAPEVMSGVLGIWGASGVSVEVVSAETGDARWIDLDAP